MVQVLAHRGAPGPHRENTIEAFAEAVRVGADGVEFDVRRTSDGVFVVHHDAVLDGAGPISALARPALPGWVPTLEAALDACGNLLVNVEVKSPLQDPGRELPPTETEVVTLAEAVAGEVQAGGRRGPIVVSSFDTRVLDAFHRAAPEVETALLCWTLRDPRKELAALGARGHRGIHPEQGALGPALVEAARKAGLAVRTWTVDDPARIAEVARLGVDAVITNCPSEALQVLGRSPGGAPPEETGSGGFAGGGWLSGTIGA